MDSPGVAGAGSDRQSDGGDGVAVLRDCLAENYERLYRRLRRFLGCADQARDCLHDAWLHLGEMAVSTVVGNPAAYVYRVACNVAIDRVRGNRLWQCAGDPAAGMDDAADPAPGPHAVAEARSDLAAVERAIRSLPMRHQYILMELRVSELTRQEVAALHGISLRRVDTVLRQALDYCAEKTGQRMPVGARTAPRVAAGIGKRMSRRAAGDRV